MTAILLILSLAQDPDLEALRNEAAEHFDNQEFDRALDLYAKILERQPGDEATLYNSACAHARAGRPGEAADALRRAVDAGFGDFDRIRSDPDLESVRETDAFKEILGRADAAEREAFEKRLEETKEKLGETYREARDEERRIVLLSDLPEDRLESYLSTLRRYQDALHKEFFEHLPDYDILVLIPSTPEEYRDKLGGRSGAAGFYRPSTRTLTVNIQTGGGTMVHEWTHAMHFADMRGLNQRHPIWIVEGFGSLFEQTNVVDGRPVGFTNWRLPGLQRALREKRTFPLEDFVKRSERYFRQDSGISYAQTRYIFYWMQEKRVLRRFYRWYVEGYQQDRTGLAALEKAIGKPLPEWTPEWEEFVMGLRFDRAGPSRPRMGVSLEAVEQGLRITSVTAGSGAAEAGLQAGDVICEADGTQITTVEALQALLAKKKSGDRVKAQIERNGETLDVEVPLK